MYVYTHYLLLTYCSSCLIKKKKKHQYFFSKASQKSAEHSAPTGISQSVKHGIHAHRDARAVLRRLLSHPGAFLRHLPPSVRLLSVYPIPTTALCHCLQARVARLCFPLPSIHPSIRTSANGHTHTHTLVFQISFQPTRYFHLTSASSPPRSSTRSVQRTRHQEHTHTRCAG